MDNQITHVEARKLIQSDSDGGLKAAQKGMLQSHLAVCPDCQKYSEGIKNLEGALHPLLRRQWNRQPIPLSMEVLHLRVNSRISEGVMLATRITAIGVMFMAFMFSAWQLSTSSQDASGPALADGPAMPPLLSTSTQRTTATTEVESCTEISYAVQKNDTLDRIAFQFSVDRREILLRNNLLSENVTTGTQLIIPICDPTPTGTVHTLTTTFIPGTGGITSTPGGY